MDNVSLNFKVPRTLYDLLKAESQKKNIGMASMIRFILSEYFEKK